MKDLLSDFVKDMAVKENLSEKRIRKYYSNLSTLIKSFGLNFEDPTTENIKEVVLKINQSDYSEWTKRDFRLVLRKYCKWFNEKFNANIDVSFIKLGKVKNKLMPEEILTKEEVLRIVDFCDNVRDKAIVSILYEAGLRAGELLSLKLKNVIFDNYGAILIVDGKTGRRRIRIVASAKLLAKWIEQHPLKDNPEAPLWITKFNRKNGNGKYSPLEYRGLVRIVKEASERAGIKKRVYPHLFRHSRATHLASVLPESVMKKYFGWAMDSRMIQTYVHLSGKDVDKALLSLYGIEKIEPNGNNIKMVKCPRCGALNPEFNAFCERCGSPLRETFLAKENKFEKLEKLLVKFLKMLADNNPEIKKMFVEFVEKEKASKIFESN